MTGQLRIKTTSRLVKHLINRRLGAIALSQGCKNATLGHPLWALAAFTSESGLLGRIYSYQL